MYQSPLRAGVEANIEDLGILSQPPVGEGQVGELKDTPTNFAQVG